MPNYNQTLQTNNSSLEEILVKLNSMPDAGEGLDTSDATASAGDILSGKTAYVDGEKITGAIETVPQATPTISINTTTGLITASTTQVAGYVTAGTKSATSQLAFKAATTITPGTIDQTAVAANTYVGGAITVKGDANLVASNIVSGKSIFGVQGTATAGGGSSGDTSVEDGLVDGTISNYTNSRIKSIRSYAFYYNSKLKTVSFPAVTSIYAKAFYNCTSLTTADFPTAKVIGDEAFIACGKLKTVSFPAVTSIGASAFYNCTQLTAADFPVAKAITTYAFYGCYNLTTADFPVATTIGASALRQCSKLTIVNSPKVTSIAHFAFANCSSLTTVSFPAVTTISSYVFYSCFKLISLYLTGSSVCKLSNSNAFSSTPIGGYSASAKAYGSIYVPASLLTSYKTATNWSYFSSRFVGI